MRVATKPEEHVSDASLKAVILYDDWELAAQASASFGRATRRADETTHWSVSPWRFDLLSEPATAQAAHREAQAAAVILFASRDVAAVSPSVMAWLEAWAERREIPDAALAVFGAGKVEATPTPLPPLAGFVQKHGLSFIAGQMPPIGHKQPAPGSRQDSGTLD